MRRMPLRAILLLTATAALAAPSSALAQRVEAGINTAGLVSIQPVDPAYVGPNGPYLDRALGVIGPSVSAGLNVVINRVALVFEYSTAWLSAEQLGRLVSGSIGTGRLRDSMISALAGAQLGRAGRLQL